jgi:hypothetical protein
MLLRNYPLMSYKGVPSWPPEWIGTDGLEDKRPKADARHHQSLWGDCQSQLGSHRAREHLYHCEERSSASFSYFFIFSRFKFAT